MLYKVEKKLSFKKDFQELRMVGEYSTCVNKGLILVLKYFCHTLENLNISYTYFLIVKGIALERLKVTKQGREYIFLYSLFVLCNQLL